MTRQRRIAGIVQVQAILAAHGITAGDIIGELATAREGAADPDFDNNEQSDARVRTLDAALKLLRMTPCLPEASAACAADALATPEPMSI